MSDMPRPRSLPPAPDHEQHDPLLVSQLAAGDPLEAEQQRDAQRLVASCGACAELAADLRAVAGAVAWEPVPPRGRDFRIDAKQAEQLRGNAASRFLRRLTLPQARTLRPAAAGLMSIGLVFVVAGYAWPDDGSLEMATGAAPAAVEESVDRSSVPADPPPVLAGAPAVDAERLAAEASVENAAEPQAAMKSLADDVQGMEEMEMTELGQAETRAAAAADAFAVEPDTEPLMESNAEILSDVDALQLGEGYLGLDAVDDTTSDIEEPGSGAAIPLDDGLDLASLLLVAGIGLALLGGLLLILAWLARRASDPLLR